MQQLLTLSSPSPLLKAVLTTVAFSPQALLSTRKTRRIRAYGTNEFPPQLLLQLKLNVWL